MTTEEIKEEVQEEVKTFTQEDIDKLNAKHQEEMDKLAGKMRAEFKEKEAKAKADLEKQMKQATMTETEKLTSELEEYKAKYQEQASINELAQQKEETRKLMTENGVDLNCLDFVFVPQDIESTKARIQAFKEYTNGVKKATFEGSVKSTIPQASKPEIKDDFEDGFDNGLHFNK